MSSNLRLDIADDYILVPGGGGDQHQQQHQPQHRHDMMEDSFSCPSSTASSFSSVSSPYGPVTPVSGRSGCSSPQERHLPTSFDVGFSASLSIGIDMTPPTSASGNYFSLPCHPHPDSLTPGNYFRETGYPTTPTRCSGSGASSSSNGHHNTNGMVATTSLSQPAQSHGMDIYQFCTPLTTSPPFMNPSPAYSVIADSGSIWSHDSGPINFFETTPVAGRSTTGGGIHQHSIKQEPSADHESTDPYSAARQHQHHQQRRIPDLAPVLSSTARLQKAQRSRALPRTQQRRRTGGASTGISSAKGDRAVINIGGLDLDVQRVPPPPSRCDFPGCNKAFQRPEHQKRHIKSVHLKVGTVACECCGAWFHNRMDNLLTHAKKHMIPERANSRVKYDPKAADFVRRLTETMRPRGTGRRSANKNASPDDDGSYDGN